MSESKRYLLDLKEGGYPWENLFVAECVEHVLPTVRRKWPPLAQDLDQATALVKRTQSTDDQYGDRLEALGLILAKLLATASCKGGVFPGASASFIVVTAASLADCEKDERAWQEQQFKQYKNSNPSPRISN